MPGILTCFDNLTLTDDQQQAALAIEAFLADNDPIFLLRGYAGTGKTTLLSGICQYINTIQGREIWLMAPTGRAARVLGDKNEVKATTVHRGIYNFHELEVEEGTDEHGQILDGFQFVYKLASDASIVRQVFIIDEASMVSDAYAESEFFRFGSGFLLRDLLTFAKVGQANIRTQLIFVGDPAQLPPFGMNYSPALSEAYFHSTYHIKVQSAELRQVVRQGGESGILALATQIRKGITAGYFNYFDIADNGCDVRSMPFGQFWPAYNQENRHKIIITYTNKLAKSLNDQVRSERFGEEAPLLIPGDMIIVGQNNYAHSVTNGTFGMIQTVGETEIRTVFVRGERPVALRWQSVGVLVRGDDNELKTIQALTLLNFLESDEGKLNSAEMRAMFIDFSDRADAQGIRHKTPAFSESLKVDPYYSALMIKHAYAITCHKAQGGEWKQVFTFWDKNTKDDFDARIDEQLPVGRGNADFFRWAYTAITRSSDQLLAINPPRITPFSKMTWIDTALTTQFQASQGVETCTINWGDTEERLVQQFGVANREPFIKYKLVEIWYRLQATGITISSTVSKPYQEHLLLRRDKETARLLLHYDGKQRFTRHAFLLADASLQQDAEAVLAKPMAFTFTIDKLSPMVPMAEYEPDADKPFLLALYTRFKQTIEERKIRIIGTESQQFRERYHVERQQERAVLDFIYDGEGFFSYVKPLESGCNSPALLNDLHGIVQQIRL